MTENALYLLATLIFTLGLIVMISITMGFIREYGLREKVVWIPISLTFLYGFIGLAISGGVLWWN